MKRENIYFIISSIIVVGLSLFSILNVDAVMKSTLESISSLPFFVNGDMVSILNNRTFYIVPSILSIIIGCSLLLISIKDRLNFSKNIVIILSIFLLLFSGNNLVFGLAIVNIVVGSNLKKANIKKKDIPHLERYTYGLNGKITAVLCFIIYFLYMFFFKPNGYISSMISSFIIIGIIVLLFFDNLKRDFIIFGQNIKNYISFILPRIGIMYVIFIVCSLICFFINKDISVNQQQINAMPDWYVLILSTCFAPIVEEILFRGCIRRFIKNDTVFIIVSAVLFGLLHTISEGSVVGALFMSIPYAVLGGGFAYIYAKTNNITNNILCHAVHNFIVSLINLFLF